MERLWRDRSRPLTGVLVVALAALGAIALVALHLAPRPKPDLAPEITLIDQNAAPFRLSSLRGHPVALLFGYTHCPDACPMALSELTHAMHSRGAPPGIRVVFVTVDPARDTPATLKRYVRLFDPAVTGVTGTPKALAPVYAAYHTWYMAVPVKHGPTNYSVAHGTRIYYVARDGTMKAFGDYADTPAQMTKAFKELQ